MKKQRWKNKALAWVLAGVLALGGCTGKSPESGNSDNSGDVFSSGMTEYQFLEEGNVTESVSVEENTKKVEYASGGKNEVITGKSVLWEDNTVDDYYAFINQLVEKVETEGEISGGGRIFVNEGGCVRHGNHNYASYTKDWDGINGITADAFEYHLQLEVDTGREGNQIDDIGPISGQKGYVTCFYIYENGKPSEYWLYKLDDRFQVVDRVHADLTSQGFVRSIMGDANGNFHITYDSSSGMKKYVVLSQYGKFYLKMR